MLSRNRSQAKMKNDFNLKKNHFLIKKYQVLRPLLMLIFCQWLCSSVAYYRNLRGAIVYSIKVSRGGSWNKPRKKEVLFFRTTFRKSKNVFIDIFLCVKFFLFFFISRSLKSPQNPHTSDILFQRREYIFCLFYRYLSIDKKEIPPVFFRGSPWIYFCKINALVRKRSEDFL